MKQAQELRLLDVVSDPIDGLFRVCDLERQFIMEQDFCGLQVEAVQGKWMIFGRFWTMEGFWYDAL